MLVVGFQMPSFKPDSVGQSISNAAFFYHGDSGPPGARAGQLGRGSSGVLSVS